MHSRTIRRFAACVFILCMNDQSHSADAIPADSPTGAVKAGADSAATAETVEIWVILSEPELATLPRDASEQRAALRERILKQQNEVMAQLAALGATESGRTQQMSNAIAVKLPAAAVERVKGIEGVVGVRPVTHRNRIGD